MFPLYSRKESAIRVFQWMTAEDIVFRKTLLHWVPSNRRALCLVGLGEYHWDPGTFSIMGHLLAQNTPPIYLAVPSECMSCNLAAVMN